MSQKIAGSFASGGSATLGQISDVLVIPSNVTTARLNLSNNIDASNTCKTQKSTNSGGSWADQTTYNSAQSNVAVTVANGEQWRIAQVAGQATKQIGYSFSAES